jgi:hypothetical protein
MSARLLHKLGDVNVVNTNHAKQVERVTEDYGPEVGSRCAELLRSAQMTIAAALEKALNERDMHQIGSMRRFSHLRFNDQG